MTYSTRTKSELCRIRPAEACCMTAEAYGLLLYARLLGEKHDTYSTDHKSVAALIGELAASVCGVYMDVLTYPKSSSGSRFAVRVPNEEQKKMLRARFAEQGGLLEKECCVNAFLRGVFLVCGTVTEPESDYHLEFAVNSERRCQILADVMRRAGIRCHSLQRNDRWVLYLKEADGITRLMQRMGAPDAAQTMEHTRQIRDCRNNANRRTNCDQANIDRTISAAEQQCAAIRRLTEKRGMNGIPPELREIASLRLENPDMSLRELSESLSEPITRSGVNHRLKKLMELAEES